jgi:hypothetical protein
MFDLSGNPISIEVDSVNRYFERAVFAYNNACNPEADPRIRAMLTAFCLHACQSLREALQRLADKEPENDEKLRKAVAALPFSALIEEVRNHDIHGFPLPVCDPKVISSMWVANPDKPMKLTSSHGVGVSVQMRGAKPKVRLSPKDQKHGKFTPGQSMSYHCVDGELIVHDLSTNKDFKLLGVLGMFLKDAQTLVVSVAQQVGT